ncbi:unnamed protein product, partial [Ectocarpus sp. 13 AM-2016]
SSREGEAGGGERPGALEMWRGGSSLGWRPHLLSDGADCSGASHVGCCDPPLQGVPDGDWFCSECVATGGAP